MNYITALHWLSELAWPGLGLPITWLWDCSWTCSLAQDLGWCRIPLRVVTPPRPAVACLVPWMANARRCGSLAAGSRPATTTAHAVCQSRRQSWRAKSTAPTQTLFDAIEAETDRRQIYGGHPRLWIWTITSTFISTADVLIWFLMFHFITTALYNDFELQETTTWLGLENIGLLFSPSPPNNPELSITFAPIPFA